ncbi:MAG: 2-oxo acid dehydrogenase subunit E2 [Ferruginibacter sp.]|nr:2-oxo acid dehydrogenase subunit E2 [Cytophagales bacterium]
MAEVIRMPKMSDTMTEGVIAAWHKKVGDTVKSGDLLAEVETDKATMELESYNDGTLLYIGPQERDAVPVDGILAVIGEKGEEFQSLVSGASGGKQAGEEPRKEVPAPTTASTQPAPPPTSPVATPAPATVAAPAKVNATVIRMPKMSDTMTEGVIVSWNKKVGDAVKSGELLAEVETDKATMELESYEDGTLLYVGVEAGQAVAVDGILAVVGEQGADYQALLNGGNAVPSAVPVVETPATHTQPSAVPAEAVGSNGRVKASPLAKSLAKEKGIDIARVPGTGEQGRIVKRDVESFAPPTQPAVQPPPRAEPPVVAPPAAQPGVAPSSAAKSAPQPAFGQEGFDEVPVSQMRKTIARRLAESKFTAPHFYLTMEIRMDQAIELRTSLNEYSPVKISFNDLVLKAAAIALKQHPKINSSWLGDKIRFNHHVHIGVAVAVEEGLLVPVVRFADTKTLSTIAGEVKDLGARAKNKQLQPKDWEGNTFTISNLGMFGIDEFTAIINTPDACILAVGGIKQTAVVKDGQIAVGNLMKVTLSCDHRVVDGASGAAFLQTLRDLLEQPMRMLV